LVHYSTSRKIVFTPGYCCGDWVIQANCYFYVTRLKALTYSFEAFRQLPDAALAAIVYAPEVSSPWCENARRLELDGRMPYFLSELKRTGVRRLLLWEEYRKEFSDPFR